ncbi:MAG: hypothetical protein R6V10_05920 [bacterium]
MKECKLTRDKLDQALQGELSEEERKELVEHLESGCEECERFFAELPDEYEQALLYGAMASERSKDINSAGSELGGKRAVKASSQKAAELYGNRPAKSWKKILPMAASLVLVAALVFFFVSDHQKSGHHQNIKGPGITTPLDISLRFVTMPPKTPEGRKPKLERGMNHAVLPQGTSLMFRYRISGPAHVYLTKVTPDKNVTILRSEQRKSPGAYDFEENEGLYSYTLSGPAGSRTFCAASFHEETSLHELEKRVLLAFTENRKQQHKDTIKKAWMDCFEVEVKPWQGKSGPR